MRQLIKASASLFIVIGGVVVVGGVLAAAGAFMTGAASPDANFPQMIGFIVALAGAVSGSSIVLVGGTAYLLATIDERIETAIKRRAVENVA
jgi:hypothetical protein